MNSGKPLPKELSYFWKPLEVPLGQALHPWTKDHWADFPKGMSNERTRAVEEEDAASWLRRMHATFPETFHDMILDDRLALTGTIVWRTWSKGHSIVEAHLQAVVATTGNICDLVLGNEDMNAVYLRLDYEPNNVGQMALSTPNPHIHVTCRGEPRFHASSAPTLPHLDFIEILLRNYFPEEWTRWADAVFDRDIAILLQPNMLSRKEFSARVREAMMEKKEVLDPGLVSAITRWKEALVMEKMSMTSFVPDPRAALVAY